ncbi:MAG: hypothetical protein HMLKMBBP_00063 [Planctomycetes bacterium]|nr:hypothetical protein [Planctomycetota bacterium]
MQGTVDGRINGIDAEGLRAAAAEIAADPAKGAVDFRVRTEWRGGTRTETVVDGCAIGGAQVARSFRFASDEPAELFGTNGAPNPQELLMGALNACMTVGWAAVAALRGIRIHELSIETEGSLDLRGFLGIDPQVAPGYESIRYRVRVRGDAPQSVFEEIHEVVKRTSPNYFNLSRPILLEGALVVV